jgi:hypothetical protein
MQYGLHTYATLTCNQCGKQLGWCGSTWLDAEKEAGRVRGFSHACGTNSGMSELDRQQKIEKVKELMKMMRKNRAAMSFEEECDIYGRLLRTYKLT